MRRLYCGHELSTWHLQMGHVLCCRNAPPISVARLRALVDCFRRRHLLEPGQKAGLMEAVLARHLPPCCPG